MKRTVLLVTAMVVALIALAATPAAAAVFTDNAPKGTRFVKGSGEPSCTLTDTRFSCTGTVVKVRDYQNPARYISVTGSYVGACIDDVTGDAVPFGIGPLGIAPDVPQVQGFGPDRKGYINFTAVASRLLTAEEVIAQQHACPAGSSAQFVTAEVHYEYRIWFAPPEFPGGSIDTPFILITG